MGRGGWRLFFAFGRAWSFGSLPTGQSDTLTISVAAVRAARCWSPPLTARLPPTRTHSMTWQPSRVRVTR
jgi:hypothetical protein